MIFYLFPIVTGFLFSFLEVKVDNYYIKTSITKNLFIIVTAVIFCGGYMTGSDWRNYELLYSEASISLLNYYPKEKGFYLLMIIFKEIGFGFFPFLIVSKFFVFFVVSNFIANNFKSFYLPFSIFLSTEALFLFVDNPLRFMIAFGLVVLSYKFLLNRKIIPFLLLIFLAISFHITSVIMLFIYFVPRFKVRKKYVNLTIYFILFFLLSPELFSVIFKRYFPSLIFFLGSYYERMMIKEFMFFSIGRIVYSILFVIIVMFRESILDSSKYGKQYYTYSIAYFYISLSGMVIPTFFRLPIYLVPFLCISLSTILVSKIKLRQLYRIGIASYFVLSTIKGIYSTYVYIPYTNYFTSLLKNELPYSYRANYNKNKYFERTGSWPENDF